MNTLFLVRALLQIQVYGFLTSLKKLQGFNRNGSKQVVSTENLK